MPNGGANANSRAQVSAKDGASARASLHFCQCARVASASGGANASSCARVSPSGGASASASASASAHAGDGAGANAGARASARAGAHAGARASVSDVADARAVSNCVQCRCDREKAWDVLDRRRAPP